LSPRAEEIRRLRRARPRSLFVRGTIVVFVALVVYAWASPDIDAGGIFSARGRENVARFMQRIRPRPLREQSWDWSIARSWAAEHWEKTGGDAATKTLAIAVLAILLAGAAGSVTSVLAARTVATPEPYLPSGRRPGLASRALWWTFVWRERPSLMCR
jgi:ABC-type phosphate/phosphonate transport system permease subunit